MMNVDCLEPSRPQILETVRDALRTQDDFPRYRIDHGLSDEEACTTFHDDEGFVIGMDMKPRPLPCNVCSVSQNGDRPADSLAVDVTAPGWRTPRFEKSCLRWSPSVGLYRCWVEVCAFQLGVPF